MISSLSLPHVSSDLVLLFLLNAFTDLGVSLATLSPTQRKLPGIKPVMLAIIELSAINLRMSSCGHLRHPISSSLRCKCNENPCEQATGWQVPMPVVLAVNIFKAEIWGML